MAVYQRGNQKGQSVYEESEQYRSNQSYGFHLPEQGRPEGRAEASGGKTGGERGGRVARRGRGAVRTSLVVSGGWRTVCCH